MHLLAQTATHGKACKKLKTQNACGENREGWMGRRRICIVGPVGIEFCFLFTLYDHDLQNLTTASKQMEKDVDVILVEGQVKAGQVRQWFDEGMGN